MNHHHARRIAVLIIICCSLLLGQQPRPGGPHLVIVSIDGLRPSTIRDADKLGLKIPNLREFRDKGAFAEGLRGVMPTVTYPSHTTMMTGRDPAEHGIIGNEMFDPEQRLNRAWYWYAEAIKTPTLWDVAKAAGLTTAAVSWPVTAGARIDFNVPEYRTIKTEEDLMLYRALSNPGLMAEFEKASGPLAVDEEDKGRTRIASYLIRTKKPNLMLVHIFDLDHEQHGYGPGSPESFKALEGDDAYLGMLRKEIADAGLADSTRWIIVSDHGFLPVEKSFHPNAFLASLGLTAAEGKPETWRVAAHSNGGSIAFVAKDPKDAEAQTLVRNTLEKLQKEGTWGIGQVLSRSDLDKLKGYPHAFLAVSLGDKFTNGGNRSGPWVTSSGRTRGMHGYAPGPKALDATFVPFGPGIPAQKLPPGELKDVAKTAGALLGISFPNAEGRNLLSTGR